jgi:hypothetical protein
MKRKNVYIFTILGIVFWFSAAMVVHFMGESIFIKSNQYLPLIFLMAIPITFGFIFIAQSVSSLPLHQLLKPIALMTGVAATLDGIALAWTTSLYSQSFEVALIGAAWILWGAGLGLLIGFYFDQKGGTVSSKN